MLSLALILAAQTSTCLQDVAHRTPLAINVLGTYYPACAAQVATSTTPVDPLTADLYRYAVECKEDREVLHARADGLEQKLALQSKLHFVEIPEIKEDEIPAPAISPWLIVIPAVLGIALGASATVAVMLRVQ